MNDDTPTIENPEPPDREEPTAPTEVHEPEAGPQRLTRSTSDRVIAGVAGGLGRYFGVDPVMFRIGFVLSLFFGGLGAIAYGLLWLFVPTDGEPDRGQRAGGRLRRVGFWRGLGLAFAALLGLGLLLSLAGIAAFGVAVGWGVPVAATIIGLGVVLVVLSFRGGARWLIPPAVALAVGGGIAAATDLNFRGGIGDRQYHPLSAKAIPADGYKLGIGRLVVDLRDLNWKKQRVVQLDTRLGAGQSTVLVPASVCVVGSTHVGAGESEVVGQRNDGFSVDYSPGSRGTGAKPRPMLVLDAEVQAGQLRVINSDTASVDQPGYGPGPFHQDTAPLRAAEARACATG
jgi:phage shock protein PspC (stress-responsive transcriptional regulator)